MKALILDFGSHYSIKEITILYLDDQLLGHHCERVLKKHYLSQS